MKTIKINNFNDIPENYTGIVEFSNGEKHWLLNGKFYREDGPAVELADGTSCWYLNEKLHREDGPAVEYANGDKKYWLNDKELSKNKIQQLIDLGYPEKTAIKLVFFYENNKNK